MPASRFSQFQAVNMDLILNELVPHRSLVQRATDTTSSSSPDMTCGPNACEKPTSSSTFTLPIILGVAVPLCGAAILFLILQRRHTKKQREEDANDRNASLDFGMGDVSQPGRPNRNHRTSGSLDEEKSDLSRRQISMDMTALNNPYLPSPGLQNSRESLQSLSKVIQKEDPYRPVPEFLVSDTASLRSQKKQVSSETPHVMASKPPEQPLAKRSSSNAPEFTRQSSFPHPSSSVDQVYPNGLPYPSEPPQAYLPNESSLPQNGWEAAAYTSYQPQPISYPPALDAGQQQADMNYENSNFQSQNDGYRINGDENYGFQTTSNAPEGEPTLPTFAIKPPSALYHETGQLNEQMFDPALSYSDQYNQAGYMPDQNFSENIPQARLSTRAMDPNRISMGFRPLPPDNFIETDDPEIRANRIRSFYKEYFDESTPAPVGQYYEETNYYDERYKPTDQYSQISTRRAMTPPADPSRYEPQRSRNGSMGAMSLAGSARGPHQFFSEPRPHSSASGRMAPSFRKQIPPPAPLSALPIPAKLVEDVSIINPIDFAPPSAYRGGRPEKNLGDGRPFTPVLSAHQELSPMPSPHMLRNSKSFTSLDFAPPKKFRDPDCNSDAGSIRSFKSGVSSNRNRAYTEDVYMPNDNLKTSLKPQWDMTSR